MILVVTVENDLHAIAVQRVLHQRGYANYRILACNKIASSHQLGAHLSDSAAGAFIVFPDGSRLDLVSVEAVWWRRVGADQELDSPMSDDFQTKLINNDCRGAVSGILETYFDGVWISSPDATFKASDKIYQLATAKRSGFRIPETLISQSRAEVQVFRERHNGRIIVKPVVGIAGPLLFTQFIEDVGHFDQQSFQKSPAIYQEYVPGKYHIRLNCFGNESFAALIETEDLDWRPNLKVPIRQWSVPDWLHRRVRLTLDELDLEMGIVDLKLMPDGDVVWLEVNPQGQFLFLEGLTGMPLAQHFADFLLRVEEFGSRRLRARNNREPKKKLSRQR